MKKTVLIIIMVLLGGCQVINLHIFDSNSAKIELLNKIINNPEKMDSIIKNSKFFNPEIGKYFFKNPSAHLSEFLNKNKGKKVSLLYNKKFTITRYPVKNVYENGKDIYFHEISFIYEDGESDWLKNGNNVLLIGFEFRNSKWYFDGLGEWTKESLNLRYKNLNLL